VGDGLRERSEGGAMWQPSSGGGNLRKRQWKRTSKGAHELTIEVVRFKKGGSIQGCKKRGRYIEERRRNL